MDVIVVGAGPAGTMAAKAVAEKGYPVTVYEKGPLRREKPCGGAVSDRVVLEFGLDIEVRFWDRICTGIFLCSPENRTVLLTDEAEKGGFMVMREKFDHYLMEISRKSGVKFVENTYLEPFLKDGKMRGVRIGDEVIESDIVIACDGTPSSFARKLGIYTGNDYNQAATFQYQMGMDNKDIDEKIGDNMEIYFGYKWVPSGYTWIFPKNGIVTVGNGTWLHTLRKCRTSLKERLDTFIHTHPVASEKLENCEILYSQSAMIGFTGIVKDLYLDNFMIAGDAAGFVSVPTGEGIYYSMVSGRIAGEVAAEALNLKDTSRKILKEYKKRADKKIGADMKWGYWLRRLIMDRERNQEHLIRASLKDEWIYTMTGQLIGGDIGYRPFLLKYGLRPHKLLKLLWTRT